MKKIKKDAKKKAEEEIAENLREKDDELKNLKTKISDYRKLELNLKRQEREFEEKEHTLNLQLEEKLKEESTKIWKNATEKVEDEYKLKYLGKDKTINDLKKQIDDLKRKADQGSTQLQGEIQEIEIEKILSENFPSDEIKPIKVGKKGGDIIQKVKSDSGRDSGSILWESKRTKNWKDSWISKLKGDQREEKADIAVIASEVLPDDIREFGNKEGIWITNLKHIVGLATSLRFNLIQVYQARASLVGMTEKRDLVYKYLTGKEFKQRVESMLETFRSMHGDLMNEKSAMEKAWAKREKQIGTIIQNVAGIYGDLQGLGAALLPVKNLELPESNEHI